MCAVFHSVGTAGLESASYGNAIIAYQRQACTHDCTDRSFIRGRRAYMNAQDLSEVLGIIPNPLSKASPVGWGSRLLPGNSGVPSSFAGKTKQARKAEAFLSLSRVPAIHVTPKNWSRTSELSKDPITLAVSGSDDGYSLLL